MRCSECSRQLKPIVVFDIDGTIGDYHKHFTGFCVNYFGRSFSPGYTGSGNFEDWLGLTRTEYREAKLAYRQSGAKRWMPTFPGMVSLVQGISVMDVEVWFATTRPWQRLDNIDPDTREFLRRNGIPIDGLLYGDDKYRQLAETVDIGRIAIAVEDLPDQFDLAISLGIPCIQVERTHNSSSYGRRFPSVSTPHGLKDLVLAMVGKWQAENQGE